MDRLLNLTWPLGHFVLLHRGWLVFTLRRRRHWWNMPWYTRGIGLAPYRVAIVLTFRKEANP